MSARLLTATARLPWHQPLVLGWSALLLFVGIAVLPILLMLHASLVVDGGFSLHHYQSLLSESRILGLLARSMTMALGATLLALVFGVPLALLLVKTGSPGHGPARVLYLVPLFIPPHIHALAWIDLLGDRGVLQLACMGLLGRTMPLVNLYSPAGGAVILFLAYCPILVLTVVTGLSRVDSRLEEAGSLHSAPFRVWRTITLPLISPYILSGAVFVWIFSFFNYGVPSMLRVPSFPVEIFTRFSALYDEAGATALSTPLIGLALLLLLCQKRFMAGRSCVTISTASRSIAQTAPGQSLPARLYIWCFLVLTIGLPLCALIIRAESWQSFQMAWQTSSAELITSLWICSAAATLATILAYFLAMYLEELSNRWHDLVHTLTLLPFAFPATLFGIGLIHLWNRPATQLVYTGMLILMLAYIARFIPFAIRIVTASLSQISPALREAACIANHSRLTRFFRIDLPLARRGLCLCWVVVFTFSMGELGATLLVIPPGQGTISLKIYTLMHYGAGPLVAALALLLIGVNLLVSSSLLLGGKQY